MMYINKYNTEIIKTITKTIGFGKVGKYLIKAIDVIKIKLPSPQTIPKRSPASSPQNIPPRIPRRSTPRSPQNIPKRVLAFYSHTE